MIPKIVPHNPTHKTVTFEGYNSPLKKAWDKGYLPKVKRGLSGLPLTPQTRTLDHLKPHSQGGTTTLDNLVLEDAWYNNRRGVTPIEEITTPEMVRLYLRQFKGQKNPFFDVDEYIKGIKKFFADIVDK